ncbi:DNA repair protein RecO C-terminal domain-containing protein [Sutterella wadsworthensis]|uniref:DNA repair protein RecO C-terminal domain-containing protein n=1 Tax=Sutterella wadsworthensis TaxID=40545 RepID=UPI003520E0CB
MLRLTEREDVHPGLFQSYVHVLSALADEDPAVRQTGLRSFEAELLAHCGWGLALEDRDLKKGRRVVSPHPRRCLEGRRGDA